MRDEPVAIFRSPLFRNLLLSAFVLIAGTLLVLDFFLTSYITKRETKSAQERLIAEVRILRGEVEGADRARVQNWAQEASERSGTRITFVDPKGMVLADSEHDPETMENHADRPEILQARRGQTGVSIRHSSTLNRDLCYVALNIPDRGVNGFILRLAVPLEQLDSAVAEVRRWLLGVSLIALAVSMLAAYAFSARFTQRIRRIQSFAERLPENRASQDLTSEADDELGALSRSMNRMAAQLRESIERLNLESARREAILSSMAEGVLAVDQHMHVTFCNESFARLAGLTLPIPQHAPLLEVVRDAGLLDMLSQTLTSEKPVKRRLELPAGDGRSFEAQAAPLTAPSRQGAIAVLHDITDLERLEIVRKDFVANVSHELRTPLASIRGYAETLLEGALEDPQNNRKFLEIIKAQAARLNNIASDLLMLSELESNRAETGEPEHFSLHNVIENALRTVESEARVRDVRLIRGRVEDASVTGSKIGLEQALVNLLDNAIKFNRPFGEVRIDVIGARDRNVRIMIADTGIGIPSGVQSRIFERFYRVDKARSRSVGGTGLGLSIVKHVLERMNGSITVESELGKGSVFTVTLSSGGGS